MWGKPGIGSNAAATGVASTVKFKPSGDKPMTGDEILRQTLYTPDRKAPTTAGPVNRTGDDKLPAPPADSGLPTLKVGAKGPDVEMLQELLKEVDPTIVVDGRFGPKTQAALEKYQVQRGLLVDGIAGPESHGALLFDAHMKAAAELIATPPPAGDPATLAAWRDAIKHHTREAGAYLADLRPESKAAHDGMMGELSLLMMKGEKVMLDVGAIPNHGGQAGKAVVPEIARSKEASAEEVKAALATLAGMDIEQVTDMAIAGKFGSAPREVQMAVLGRLGADYRGWLDSPKENARFTHGLQQLGVQMLEKDCDPETLKAIVRALDDEYVDYVLDAQYKHLGDRFDATMLRAMREAVNGESWGNFTSKPLRAELDERLVTFR